MRTVRPLFVLLVALLLALASATTAVPAAAQGGGSHGDVKVHSGAVESPARESNDPKVCTFHFHGTNFDATQVIDWHVDEQDPQGAKNLITGSATTDANGDWATGVYSNLPNGHYKLFWQIRGVPEEPGQGDTKHKVFEVTCSTIQVQKYDDVDGDAKKDAAEPYLAGWAFNVTLGSTTVGTMTTNAEGIATLKVTDLDAGPYTVTEVLKSGWTNTEPGNGHYDVSVKKGKTSELLFGNHYTPSANGTIRIFKYSDVNNNGAFDTGDLGLSGWGFTVKDGQGASVGTITTGADGNGTLSIAAGTYTIYENLPLPANWTNTDPTGATPSKPVTVTSGQQTDIVRFGNHYTAPTPPPPPPLVVQGSLLVTKYNDADRDGTRDAGEVGLAGWTFNVRSGSTIVRTVTTDANGHATASGLDDGTYIVAEVTRAGWISTDPGTSTPMKTVSVTSGSQATVVFGNAIVLVPSTTQTQVVIVKYADANANGVRDTGEGALANFTFSVRDASGALVRTAVTGGDGLATILGLPLGPYTIAEEPRTGWVNTEPGGNATRAINLTSTATSATVLFGNAQVRLPSTATDDGTTGPLLVILFIAGLAIITMADRAARRT